MTAASTDDRATTERTPLLSSNTVEDAAIPASSQKTPLPLAAVLTLCFCRTTEPIAMTVIFPFINQAIADSGVDPSEVGFRAGLIESLFTFTQFLTILQWGRLSDRVGRKPVILFGLAGCSVSVMAFGLSRTFVAMVISRMIAGLLNGNVGVLKSSLAELTDHTNEAQAFTYLTLSWPIGSALGPILGGYLANPVKRYPNLFGNSTFMSEYKYFLPCFVGGIFPIVGIITAWFFLRETLPRKTAATANTPAQSGTSTPTSLKKTEKEVPTIRSVVTRRVCITLTNYAFLAFTSMSIAGIMPLWMFTPVKLGGLGFTEAQIGKALSILAILTASGQSTVFAPLQRRVGTVGAFRTSVVCYPIVCALFPLTSYIARFESSSSSPSSSGTLSNRNTWIMLSLQLIILSLAGVCYSANMLLINSSAPSQHALGTLNGIAQMLASLMRTLALAISPSLFALSIKRHWMGGQAIWGFMFVMGIGLVGTSWLVRDSKASWRDEDRAVAEEEESEQ